MFYWKKERNKSSKIFTCNYIGSVAIFALINCPWNDRIDNGGGASKNTTFGNGEWKSCDDATYSQHLVEVS